MKANVLRAAVLAALLPAFVAGCSASSASPIASTATTTSVTERTAAGRAGLPDFTRLAEQAGPAVVNITVSKPAPAQAQGFDGDDPFSQFFRQFGVPAPKPGPLRGLGSGFIVSSDGYILTNAHVVDGAKEVNVKLTDRREFRAKVIGEDTKSDIALIKIDAASLPTVRIGDSSHIRVGQWVVAMGSPFGFENSVTAGIVSAKSRSLSDSYVPFIQTDVAVNPGNSGGPLFDLDGNVIGINSQIYSQTGGYQGLSFAIPIDIAMHVKDQLQKSGKVTRGRIGVTVQGVNQSLAQSFGLPRPEGALVASVESGSPAERAGIKSGDVILAFNGQAVDDSSTLPMLVADMKPGQSAPVRVWRNGAERTLQVTVGTMAAEQVAASDQSPEANSGRLGLAVRALTPEEKRELKTGSGLVVEQVSGAAEHAGIQPGDVILALNDQPVRDVAQLRRLIGRAGKHVALLVQRDESKMYVPVDLG
ncbi:MAG TPA: DegQ family serine endoprotease [Burkholderiales bacterium]